jgi:hypothetical protein
LDWHWIVSWALTVKWEPKLLRLVGETPGTSKPNQGWFFLPTATVEEEDWLFHRDTEREREREKGADKTGVVGNRVTW